jgi:hypothetical protein
MKSTRRLWWGIILLILLSPWADSSRAFKSGPAWGEWSLEEIEKMLGFIPEKLKGIEQIWKAPLQGYSLSGSGSTPLEYILSALIGIATVSLLSLIIIKALGKGTR